MIGRNAGVLTGDYTLVTPGGQQQEQSTLASTRQRAAFQKGQSQGMKEMSKGSLKCLLNTKAFRKTETPPQVLGVGLLKTEITWTFPPLTVEATGSHLWRGNEESGK